MASCFILYKSLSDLSSLQMLFLREVQILKRICKSAVNGRGSFFCLPFQVVCHISLICALPLAFLPVLEGGQLLLIAAGADEALGLALPDKFHLLVTYRTSGVCLAG